MRNQSLQQTTYGMDPLISQFDMLFVVLDQMDPDINCQIS